MPRSARSAAFTRAVMTESSTTRFSLSSMAAAYSASERREALLDLGIRQRFHLADIAVAIAVERDEVGPHCCLGRLAGVLSPRSSAERRCEEQDPGALFHLRPTIGVGPVCPHDVFHAPRRSGHVAAGRLELGLGGSTSYQTLTSIRTART